jgi:2,3-dihydroxybiphenyl 1,2-dioxygenase
MKIAALGYVGINATDAQAWARFGPEILGLRAAPVAEDGTVHLQMDERAYRLAIHPASSDGLAYIGWEIASPIDFEQACVELEKAGLGPARGSEKDCALRQVAALVKFADPYGNRLELFYGQLNICEAFQPARPIGGFVTGSLGLGHVVMGAPDLEAGKKFYTETLGFRLSDFVPDRLVFFHCNPRHHSIAFGKIGPGLRHIMLEVKTVDDVGKTFDLCQASGVPITKTLGRHSNDGMFSFYMKSPGGFEIEYGTEGRIVDDATWSVQQVDRGSLWGHQRIPG